MSHASEDTKKLLIGFDVDEEELTGTGSIFLIDGLKNHSRQDQAFSPRDKASVRNRR